MLEAPILRFDTLDSTNNCAAQMIDADKAQPGLTIIAKQQTAGKGQRGKIWQDSSEQSLLMSIILQPNKPIDELFDFSASIAVALAELIHSLDKSLDVRIKFPNDIIVNDKKAAGILIENLIRGNTWSHAIVGVGINVLQDRFSDDLPHATSLFQATNKAWVLDGLLLAVRQRIIEYSMAQDFATFHTRYNQLLYKRAQYQKFRNGDVTFEAMICMVNKGGKIVLQHNDGQYVEYANGDLVWVW